MEDTRGQGLFDEFINALRTLELDLGDLRGQGYDNGSNMKGKHKGVQKKSIRSKFKSFLHIMWLSSAPALPIGKVGCS